MSAEAAWALKGLADAAHDFALKWKPRPTVTGAYERALNGLVRAARVFAEKSDVEWATEVAALREEVRRCHVQTCACALCDR